METVMAKYYKLLNMKKLLIIPVLMAVALTSCYKNNPWLDHDNPVVYIPRYGVTFNTAWMLDNNEYNMNFGVYLSGVRPENQNDNITVGFTVSQAIVDAYNADITQKYSGRMESLPAACYSITGTSVTIPKGDVTGFIPVKINVANVAALPVLNTGGDSILYVIPILLNSTSKYNLHADPVMKEALAVIRLDTPRFYFWSNRNGAAPIGKRLIYTDQPKVENFRITSYGVPMDADYTLTIGVNTGYAIPADGALLPADAYEIPSSTVKIEKGKIDAYVGVKILNNKIPTFCTSLAAAPFNRPDYYYLPFSIQSANRYGVDVEKGTLLLRVSAKNDYEWNYSSNMVLLNTSTGRSNAYAVAKSPTTVDENTLRIQMLVNNSAAGTTVNNKFYKLKLIENAANKNKWGVEIILITNEGAQSSPASLRLNPDKESYYDWDYETIYLNYIFEVGTVKYEVYEILVATF